MPSTDHDLGSILRREIAAAGPVSFARFMETALYHPDHGYYRQSKQQIGCQGDFYTNVSAGPLFGQLLGFRFAQWLDALTPASPSAPLQVVEGGAHDGRLALDVLSWFRSHRPDLLTRLEYWIVEPSPARRDLQTKLLAPVLQKVRWMGSWDDAPARFVRGVIFANELLDALPVFRVGWDASKRRWFEWKVGATDSAFIWIKGSRPTADAEQELTQTPLGTLPPDLAGVLPDGFTVELCPAARAWWSNAAEHLAAGKLLTFDYGLEWTEILAPHRAQGTLRGYRAHRPTGDPLSDPGEQDLTAHVNFSELRHAGERAGLKTDCLCSQSVFLTAIMGAAVVGLRRFGSWGRREARQFQTLTHPDHLGRAFRVLIQSRPAVEATQQAC
jgi:SAM-dependent MidA family methyltransferase